MIFHRGSWISENGLKGLNDLLAINDAQDWGSSIMETQERTTSWQQFYPNKDMPYGYGYNCVRFAQQAASKEANRKPTIVETNISAEAFEKYKSDFKLILTRGKESDIRSATSMIVSNAVIVDASKFSYAEFSQYDGELLISSSILRHGSEIAKDLSIQIFPAKGSEYNDFVASYKEGKVQPLYNTEQILDILKPSSLEGGMGHEPTRR